MKIKKGTLGYIQSQKKRRILITIFLFGISFAIFLTGYLTTHTRNNLLTIIAVLGCLPAARSAVGMIILLPYRSFDTGKAGEIQKIVKDCTTAYDLVLTSREHIMHVDVLLISRHLICGYMSGRKISSAEVERYLSQILKQNHYDKVTVKIFSDYESFLERAGQIAGLAECSDEQLKRASQEMCRLILTATV